MGKTTLKDVAEAAGISIAAVSMILSGKGKISPGMADRVKALAAEMGYSRTRGGAAKDFAFDYIAVLQQETVSFLWNFSVPFALLLEDQILNKEKIPLVFHIPPNFTPELLLREIVGAQVGAVFSMHYADRRLFRKLENLGIPVIIINNSEYQNDFWAVISDNHQAAYDATAHLIDLGHTRVAYGEYERPEYPALVAERFFGYRRALEERELPYEEERQKICVGISNFPSLLDQIARIYAGDAPPTAWVAHDDYFAACLMKALEGIGKRVPQDISIIAAGGDVLDYSLPFIPQISTMQSDKKLMVAMAWNLLESRVKTAASSVQVIKTKMTHVDRGSCLSPAVNRS